jgi:hypothetical protein
MSDSTKKGGPQDRQYTDKTTENKGTKVTGYEEIDWGGVLKESRVFHTDEPDEEQVCIWIKDEIKPIEFGTLGGFSVISGKAKSKKSFTTNLIVAAAAEGGTFDAGPFEVELPKDKRRILFFDTEQGRRRTWLSLKRVLRLANINVPTNLEYHDLRPFNPTERRELINQALNHENPQKDIGLVVIDGCRDLIKDFNSPDESFELITFLMQWSAINLLHIVTIIHQNKGNDFARGHLGTELINKCETHISVEVDTRDKSISIVNPNDTRDISFNPFAFRINNDGLPELLPDYQTKGDGDKPGGRKPFNPFNVEPGMHHKVLAKVFSDTNSIGYADLQKSLKIQWQSFSIPISNNSIQELITYYKDADRKWITHNGLYGKAAKYSYQSH